MIYYLPHTLYYQEERGGWRCQCSTHVSMREITDFWIIPEVRLFPLDAGTEEPGYFPLEIGNDLYIRSGVRFRDLGTLRSNDFDECSRYDDEIDAHLTECLTALRLRKLALLTTP